MNSAYCGLPVTAIMTMAMTSGPQVEATLKCGLGGLVGSPGAAIGFGISGRAGRGGRLNGVVPEGPTWRRRSRLRGRSASLTVRIARAKGPTSMTLPGFAMVPCSPVTGVPSTEVPFFEPRSLTVVLPSGPSSTTQWRCETDGSASVTSALGSRPIAVSPGWSANAVPQPAPATITSSMPVEGVRRRSGGGGPDAETTAPSCSPASASAVDAGTTRSPITTCSGARGPSTVRRTSSSVASGRRASTARSRSPSVDRKRTCTSVRTVLPGSRPRSVILVTQASEPLVRGSVTPGATRERLARRSLGSGSRRRAA